LSPLKNPFNRKPDPNRKVSALASRFVQIPFSVESGVPFKVLKRKGNWIFIQHGDGDKGWIHKSLTW